MHTVYLDRKHASIEVQGGSMRVQPAARGCGNIPLKLVARLVLLGEIQLTTSTLARLTDAGVSVVCLSGRGHRRVAQLCGPPGKDVARRLLQFQAAANPILSTALARELVAGKLAACGRELHEAEARRPARRRPLLAARRTLTALQEQIPGANLVSLRGLEGAGAAAWFRALATLFPASAGFNGRNRRPPRDPANAILSLCYTLLHAEAVAVCHAQGLDPMLGFLHEPAHGRESLACDLIEPLRPRIDGCVVKLFATRLLKAEHFSNGAAGCRLRKNGRQHFWPWWEETAPPFRRYLRARGHELIRTLRAHQP